MIEKRIFLVFETLVESIADIETTADPDAWIPENPLWGHCAVVSLIAQDVFGGELLRVSLEGIPEFAHMRSHYWNRFPDGLEHDFTRKQFLGKQIDFPTPEIRTREYLLSNFNTAKRYSLLQTRFLLRTNKSA